MQNIGPEPASRSSMLQLKISRDEFLADLKAACDDDSLGKQIGKGSSEHNRFVCTINANRISVGRHVVGRRNALFRVLYGQVNETADGTVLRYYFSVRKELKGAMSLFSAFVAIFFLVLLYKYPPVHGQEYLYLLPLLLPLLMALLLSRGIIAGRQYEKDLLALISNLAEGRSDLLLENHF